MEELKTILFDPMDKNGDGIVVSGGLKHVHDEDCSDHTRVIFDMFSCSCTVVRLACIPALNIPVIMEPEFGTQGSQASR